MRDWSHPEPNKTAKGDEEGCCKALRVIRLSRRFRPSALRRCRNVTVRCLLPFEEAKAGGDFAFLGIIEKGVKGVSSSVCRRADT